MHKKFNTLSVYCSSSTGAALTLAASLPLAEAKASAIRMALDADISRTFDGLTWQLVETADSRLVFRLFAHFVCRSCCYFYFYCCYPLQLLLGGST